MKTQAIIFSGNRHLKKIGQVKRMNIFRHIGMAAISFTMIWASFASAQDLTGPQGNAARSAESYLGLMGFSREGLIGQLSSSYGDGYSVADATAAVDSLNVDWNSQALRSAKQYLKMMGFSCSGLINQLSSDAGDKYTKGQATYAAQQSGAC